MMMTLAEQIIEDEGGYQRYPYRCSSGALTIGYGRNIDPAHGGNGLHEDEAAHMLRNDIRDAENHLYGVFPNWASMGMVRRHALVNMRFNLGPSRFLGFTNMIAAVKRGAWGIAGMEARDSRWWVQVGRRAERIAQEIETGVKI